MKLPGLTILIGMALTGGPIAAQETLDLDPTSSVTLSSTWSVPEIVVRSPYFGAYVHTTGSDDSVEESPTYLDKFRLAEPWLKLLPHDEASVSGWARDECEPRDDGNRLCGLRWRKAGGSVGLTTRMDEVSSRMKSGVFGENLADNVELKLDSSPEIQFEWNFR